MGLFISYWRSNHTKTVRIMKHRKNESPAVVVEWPLVGDELSDEDVVIAEAKLSGLTSESNS